MARLVFSFQLCMFFVPKNSQSKQSRKTSQRDMQFDHIVCTVAPPSEDVLEPQADLTSASRSNLQVGAGNLNRNNPRKFSWNTSDIRTLVRLSESGVTFPVAKTRVAK